MDYEHINDACKYGEGGYPDQGMQPKWGTCVGCTTFNYKDVQWMKDGGAHPDPKFNGHKTKGNGDGAWNAIRLGIVWSGGQPSLEHYE